MSNTFHRFTVFIPEEELDGDAQVASYIDGLRNRFVRATVEYELVEVPVHDFAAVTAKYDADDDQWWVSGDVHDALGHATKHQLEAWVAAHDANASLNYEIVPWVQRRFPKVDLDPEFSCFFAYTSSEDEANALADAINDLQFMVPA